MLLLLGCAPDSDSTQGEPPSSAIVLRWLASDGEDDLAHAQAALGWGLANLGASPTAWTTETTTSGARFTLDPTALTLSSRAQAALADAWAPLATSDEAARFGAVDVGRFLMRTSLSPESSAAITGACPTFADWEAAQLPEGLDYAVTTSLLVTGDRHVRVAPAPATADDVAALAEEGSGSLADGTFVADERDVLDLMPNGQPRYAAYDADGAWVPASTAGGPVGRCQWCHEDHLQPGTPDNVSLDGWLSTSDFQAWIETADTRMDERQASLDTVVDFDTYAVHEWMEQLVDAFLHPSPARVREEWETDDVPSLPTSDVAEWGWTGRYTRADVDAAWDGAAVPVMPEFRSYDAATDPQAGEAPDLTCAEP